MKKKVFGNVFANGFRQLIRHPRYRWAVILASALYFISPIDISPDVFPIVGWLDDGLIATVLVTEVSQLLLERSRAKKDRQISKPQATASATPEAVTYDVAATVIE
ncbi:MAG: YkvA family protein [Synechococcales bacterium]|nr:YkvA family protein [Synechococcales bacterium]